MEQVCLDFTSLYPKVFKMGTNYYFRRILTKEEQMKLGYRVMNADKGQKTTLENIQDIIRELTGFLHPFHLGKLSAGWEFCFRAHPDLYDDSWDDICKFLEKNISEGRGVIISEYGDTIPLEEFKDRVISHKGMQNFKHNNEPKIPDNIWRESHFDNREWLSKTDKTWWYNGEFS